MKTCLFFGLLALGPWLVLPVAAAKFPKITGTPVIDAPPLLDWPLDQGVLTPNLNDPTADLLHDLHGHIAAADLVLSTEGNYHMALKDIWPTFLAKFQNAPLASWFYTTSPPVPIEQIANQRLQIGNLILTCRPAAVVATRKVMEKLGQAGLTEGPVLPLYQDRGVVILVKKGNPKGIHSVWDLGRQGVRLITPNPKLEPGAFDNYAGSLYHIAEHDKKPPTGMSAARLVSLIFRGKSADPEKWLAGPRIHHRDLPWSVAYGRADAAIIYYHLGRYTQETFPHLFDLVPLGGSSSDPQPLPGTIITTRYLVRIKGGWSPMQLEAREKLVETLLSPEFTRVLEKRGLLRPAPGTEEERQ
jgi:hypothetical protein